MGIVGDAEVLRIAVAKTDDNKQVNEALKNQEIKSIFLIGKLLVFISFVFCLLKVVNNQILDHQSVLLPLTGNIN